MVDYRTSVDDFPSSKIYRQVSEDNKKFEFDNDIYSQEFFDFVKGILLSVQVTLQTDSASNADPALICQVKQRAMQVGKKTVMDLLAKCFHNAAIKQLTEVLTEIMKQDEALCATFLDQCFQEDHCNYLLEILLDCTDATARMYVGGLLKFIITRLKFQEKDRLFETEKITTTNENGEVTSTVEQPASLCARFIMKCLSLFNTQVAKNWARFDNFMDIIYSFGCSE